MMASTAIAASQQQTDVPIVIQTAERNKVDTPTDPQVFPKPDDEPPPARSASPSTSTSKPSKFHMPWRLQRSLSDKQLEDSRRKSTLSPLHNASDANAEAEAEDRRRRATSDQHRSINVPPLNPPSSCGSASRFEPRRRPSVDPKHRPEAAAYYDSRATTRREWKRRGTTLQEYYRENPALLPQLPFTFRYGFKRWKLALLIVFMVFDASIVPIILYYAMIFGGKVQGYITFTVVTAIWGGPAYVEFAVRSWRLFKKARFFRPLGATSRWSFDITNWIFSLAILTATVLLIVGAAPHIVWLRVLSMPGPALLLVLGGAMGVINVYALLGWKAPFRLSSTAKGSAVFPAVYYIVEDIVAVNASGGLPFREGWAARYEASAIFRKMIRDVSLFWSGGAVVMGAGLTVVVCVHGVRKEVAYGVGWATPFIWAAVWAGITVPWVRREMHRERETWQSVCKGRDGEGAVGVDG